MKTNSLLFFCFLFLLTFNLQSQNLVKEGNQWTYVTVDYQTGDLSYTNYKVDGDTLINNTAYKKIYSSLESSNNVFELENYFIRQDMDGKAFKIDANSNETLLIDHNRIQGDSFFVKSICEFKVIRKESFELNNNQSSDHMLHSYNNSDPIDDNTITGSINGFQWVKNIGNLKDPFFGPSDYCPVSIDALLPTTLVCFVSDEVLLYGDKELCSDFVTNTQELHNPIAVDLYPNPFSEDIFIAFGDNEDQVKRLLITDIHGKIYHEEDNINTPKVTIDGQDFPIGMYFVNIILKDNQRITKKIVKQ